ncbi:hypothetical protein QMA56_08080 [Leuconostoc falkenbergense]|uniref:hypothetical protein n=1 Tax=Leuconostoc falkenbergense TaxID=2766470 RepID=UPI0024AD86D6|nr:hypothetical protein [Leuconostoc falkenbergense]MDI6667666.1 hypothetical protein [Leuconostoc falkenbergense]
MYSQSSLRNKTREILPFIIIVIIGVVYFNNILFNPIKIPVDTYYQLSRIHNSSGSLIQFLYPQNFMSLGQVGVATNIFYPSFVMQLIVNAMPTVSPLLSFKMFIILLFALSGSILYFILRFKLNFEIWKSILLAVLWAAFTTYSTSNIGGEAIAKLGFPLLCFGLMNINNQSSYKYITSGILLAIYSHLITGAFLALFTFIYWIVTIFIKKSDKYIATINFLKAALYSFFGSLGVTIPIIIFSKTNNIKTPNVNLHQFQTWSVSLSDTISNPGISGLVFIMMFFVIITSIFVTEKINLGQSVSAVVALFGTSSLAWEKAVLNTPITTIQMPARIFDYSLTICFCFSLLVLKTYNDKNNHKSLYLVLTFSFLSIVASSIHKSNFPDIEKDGSMIIATNEKITSYYKQGNDGYGLASLGAFDKSSTSNENFWSLMNYSDYVPSSALKDNKTSMLRQDDIGRNFVNHDILTEQNRLYKTSDYTANYNQLSFKNQKSIQSTKIKLPVLGYRSSNISVFINGTRIPHTIKNGSIQVFLNKTLPKNSTILVKEGIPLFVIFSYILSLLSVCFLFFGHKSYMSKH